MTKLKASYTPMQPTVDNFGKGYNLALYTDKIGVERECRLQQRGAYLYFFDHGTEEIVKALGRVYAHRAEDRE